MRQLGVRAANACAGKPEPAGAPSTSAMQRPVGEFAKGFKMLASWQWRSVKCSLPAVSEVLRCRHAIYPPPGAARPRPAAAAAAASCRPLCGSRRGPPSSHRIAHLPLQPVKPGEHSLARPGAPVQPPAPCSCWREHGVLRAGAAAAPSTAAAPAVAITAATAAAAAGGGSLIQHPAKVRWQLRLGPGAPSAGSFAARAALGDGPSLQGQLRLQLFRSLGSSRCCSAGLGRALPHPSCPRSSGRCSRG